MTHDQDALDAIVTGLRRLQAEGGEGSAAIFQCDAEKNYYIQFSAQRGDTCLHGEAVSNEYLEELWKLSAVQEQTLISLGWNPPGKKGSPNFSREWTGIDSDGQRLSVAREVLKAFSDVYGFRGGGPIEVTLILE